MHQLLVIRHAKASHRPQYADFDRPLTRRGRKQARLVGRWLAENQLSPDTILSSSALRALSTASALASSSGYEGTISITKRLYESDPSVLEEHIRTARNDSLRLALVGHNPELDGFLERATGQAQQLEIAAVAVLELDLETFGAFRLDGRAKLVKLWRPGPSD